MIILFVRSKGKRPIALIVGLVDVSLTRLEIEAVSPITVSVSGATDIGFDHIAIDREGSEGVAERHALVVEESYPVDAVVDGNGVVGRGDLGA